MRSLRIENLEEKIMLAGDVTVAIVGDTVEVTGDVEPNSILVQSDITSVVLFSSLDGQTTFNGGAPDASVPIDAAGVDKLMIMLGGGGDEIRFDKFPDLGASVIPWDTTVDFENGGDGVGGHTEGFFSTRTSFRGDLTIIGHEQAEQVTIYGAAVLGNLDVRLGGGDDLFTITQATIFGNAYIDVEQGGDSLGFESFTVSGNLTILTGQGADEVALIGSNFVGGDLLIDGEQGNKDELELNVCVNGDTLLDNFEDIIFGTCQA